MEIRYKSFDRGREIRQHLANLRSGLSQTEYEKLSDKIFSCLTVRSPLMDEDNKEKYEFLFVKLLSEAMETFEDIAKENQKAAQTTIDDFREIVDYIRFDIEEIIEASRNI